MAAFLRASCCFLKLAPRRSTRRCARTTTAPIMCVRTKFIIFAHCHAFLFRPRIFSRALGCWAHRGSACTQRRKFGPRLGSVARALGIQSRGGLALVAGSLSAEPEPTRHMETPQMPLVFLFFCTLMLCTSICDKYYTSHQTWYAFTQPPYNSSRASSFSLFPL